MPVLSPDFLSRLASEILEAAGTPPSSAAIVARSLVEADLAGHDSHGVMRIPEYLDQIRRGELNPKAEPMVRREQGAVLHVDGRHGFGQVVADWAMTRLIPLAKRHGLACGGIFHCGHVGRLGPYVERAATEGCIGLAFVNGGGKEPRVAPLGGRTAVFGTNPMAAGIPRREGPPIVTDFSTAVAASGRIRMARDRGESLPEGWIIDREGRPSLNPADYYAGGSLLTAAGAKGYGLSLLVECLSGLLTGAGSPALPESGYELGNGVFFALFSVDTWMPVPDYLENVESLCRKIRSIPPAPGSGEVLLPGEPELRTRTVRQTAGIDLPAAVWEKIGEAAGRVGMKPDRLDPSTATVSLASAAAAP